MHSKADATPRMAGRAARRYNRRPPASQRQRFGAPDPDMTRADVCRKRRPQEEQAMAYFVTGATGFIGSYLVAKLVERSGPIYVLVRKQSLDRLAELREAWGVDDKRVVAIVGDLGKPKLGVSAADLRKLKGKVDHFFHLAAIYDLQASAD